MATFTQKKFLDENGVRHILDKLNDYPNNAILGSVISAIDDVKLDKTGIQLATGTANGTVALKIDGAAQADVAVAGLGTAAFVNIDDMELITVSDIDAICGSSIVSASEVTF